MALPPIVTLLIKVSLDRTVSILRLPGNPRAIRNLSDTVCREPASRSSQ